MKILEWIPGISQWRRGSRLLGAVFALLFLGLIALAILRHEIITGGFGQMFRYFAGEPIPFTERHIDFVVSSVFLFLLLVALIVVSGITSIRARVRPADSRNSQSHWAIIWRQFRKNRTAVIGAWMILLLYMVAFLAPFVATHDPIEQGHRVRERFLDPSVDHLLGTDRYARDVFSRIIYGSRISLLVGFLAVGIAVTLGTLYGAVAGYSGPRTENLMMRFVDIMLSFPTLILIVTIIALWRNQSIWLIIGVIGITSWTGVARLVRGEFLVLKQLDFFQAARALGAGTARLILRHLLPNALTPIIVAATLRVGTTILLEAGLSFLGLGVQPPAASWGNIVYDTKGNIFTEWWIPLSAGTAVVITVVAYNLFGDGLRDALDPRLRQ